MMVIDCYNGDEMNDDWMAFRRSPEQRAIMLENSDRQYRRWVWHVINIPKSLRHEAYKIMPSYLVDKVERRVKQIDKLNSAKKKLSKLFTWRLTNSK